uniref:Mating-type protein ALPHA1 n=1 Tax=Nakaseomyces delphensis TaxID=51657 RepID=MTAL1_NAKDE|nr:RecName: Full=Mating-type protein ALPHA1 [Nakaseomyces delphensis]AAO25603.1 ALPHA1 [Nakaseomyces delphensis]
MSVKTKKFVNKKYTTAKFKVTPTGKCRNKNNESIKKLIFNNGTKINTGLNLLLTQPNQVNIPPPPKILLDRIREERKRMVSSANSDITVIDIELCWEIDKFLAHHFQNTDSSKNDNYTKSNIKKPINAFIAFRAYYSQLGAGIKQNILSSILSEAWNSPETDQNIWDIFAQQFNFASARCGFVNYIMAQASSAP